MIALIFANLILTVTNLFLLRHTNGRLCHIEREELVNHNTRLFKLEDKIKNKQDKKVYAGGEHEFGHDYD
jgi:hypothetical protein